MNSPFREVVADADLNSRVARLEAQYEWLAQELRDARADQRELRKDRSGLTALGQYLEGAGLGLVILVGAFSLVLILGNL